MTTGQISGLVGFAFMLAIGQTLFKSTSLNATQPLDSVAGILSLLLIPSFWAALVLYGLATVLWIYLLQTVPLSRAYPFSALGFVIVPTLAVILFNERITPTYIIGVALIITGILVTARA